MKKSKQNNALKKNSVDKPKSASANKAKASSVKTKSPLLINWRYKTVLVFLGLALVTLIGRAAYIQVIQPDNLIKQGDLRSVRVKAIPSARGI
ncbi:MAG: peptidoglycan glycosyltransferase FtsI, partial [Vibrio sp.]